MNGAPVLWVCRITAVQGPAGAGWPARCGCGPAPPVPAMTQYLLAEDRHQDLVVRAAETSGDVPFDEPGRPGPGVVHLPQSGVAATAWTKSMGAVGECRLVIRLQQQADLPWGRRGDGCGRSGRGTCAHWPVRSGGPAPGPLRTTGRRDGCGARQTGGTSQGPSGRCAARVPAVRIGEQGNHGRLPEYGVGRRGDSGRGWFDSPLGP